MRIPRISGGKGKEYSAISVETESNFFSWLKCCDLEKIAFLNRVDSEGFDLGYIQEENYVQVVMKDDNGYIGIPFVWDGTNKIPLINFKIDAGMILAYISSMCNNELSKRKITNFIKNNQLNG